MFKQLKVKFISTLVLLILCSMTDDKVKNTESPYSATESRIRGLYDQYAVFTWSQYDLFMKVLKDKKYKVLPLNEMRSVYDSTAVVVGLRHDIDFNPFKALEMAKIEQLSGIRATYFILSTSDYYGRIVDSKVIRTAGMEHLYKEIHATGAEIGIHNDLQAVMITYGADPFVFNKEELSFYDTLKIPIYGTAAHGSPISKTVGPNYQIFSDFARTDSVLLPGRKYPVGKKSLAEFGFQYEAYFLDFNYYFSESGGKWNDPDGLAGILKKLESCKPGDRVQILVHPDWWGKAN